MERPLAQIWPGTDVLAGEPPGHSKYRAGARWRKALACNALSLGPVLGKNWAAEHSSVGGTEPARPPVFMTVSLGWSAVGLRDGGKMGREGGFCEARKAGNLYPTVAKALFRVGC